MDLPSDFTRKIIGAVVCLLYLSTCHTSNTTIDPMTMENWTTTLDFDDNLTATSIIIDDATTTEFPFESTTNTTESYTDDTTYTDSSTFTYITEDDNSTSFLPDSTTEFEATEPTDFSTDDEVEITQPSTASETVTYGTSTEDDYEEQVEGKNNVAIGLGVTFGILGAVLIAFGITYGIKRRGKYRHSDYSSISTPVHFDNHSYEMSGINDGFSYS